MILYTVIPPETIWWPEGDPGGQSLADGSRFFWLVPDGHGQWRVGRLISTEPRDYLDARWQPGRLWRDARGPRQRPGSG